MRGGRVSRVRAGGRSRIAAPGEVSFISQAISGIVPRPTNREEKSKRLNRERQNTPPQSNKTSCCNHFVSWPVRPGTCTRRHTKKL